LPTAKTSLLFTFVNQMPFLVRVRK
jgi:hypothetical protein